MAEVVPMPKLGFDMAEGTLVRQVKKDGEPVAKGEVLAEIETDKATVEVEATVGGTVKGWLVTEGQPVPVGAPMVVVGGADEKVDLAAYRTPAGGAAKPAAPAPGASPAAPASAPAPVLTAPVPALLPNASAPASPIARKMAGDAGIDIRLVSGTGPGGRVTKKDVEAYLAGGARPALSVISVTPAAADTIVPLTRLRQIIARRMAESKQTVPQFYVTGAVDMGAAMQLRIELNALVPDERKISVNDLIVKAAALALRQYPNLNASFGGDRVIRKGRVNVGIAVAVEGGLLTVVVQDADQKPLAHIAVEARAMVARARAGKILPADIEGSTFSVSNLGMYDVEHFIAIINPPEAAILASGSVQEVPVVKDGALVPGLRLKLTVSADHRVTDGAEAAQFLQAVTKNLAEPLRLLL